MKAVRINGYEELDPAKMSYWKERDVWWLYLPWCGIGNLSNHSVVEHEDDTITVMPSILVTGHEAGKPTQKHGYLTRGEWRDC